MGKSKIIVFANQKGGVGKSSLCIAFAHYLATKVGKLVGAIIDCDKQQTISHQRETDLKTYQDKYAYFQVHSFSLDNYSALPGLIESLRNTEDLTFLFDTPGTIQSQGLLTLITLSDAVICPFHFDRKTVASTATFIKFIERIREYLGQSESKRDLPLFLLPNMDDPRIGNPEEKLLWKDVREEFSKYAIITPEIQRRVALERISTMFISDKQAELVKPTYDFINNFIYTTHENNTNA